MAKFGAFEVHVEIKELRIHVKGDREIAPEVARNAEHHIAEMFQTGALLEAPKGQNGDRAVVEVPTSAAGRVRRRGARKAPSSGNGEATAPVNWNHDPAKWGTPVQGWTQPQKINWLLHVVANETDRNGGLTPTEMSDIFSAKFREAGLLISLATSARTQTCSASLMTAGS